MIALMVLTTGCGDDGDGVHPDELSSECQHDEECTEGYVCEDGECVQLDCGDCGWGRACLETPDNPQGSCTVAECHSDSDCGDGQGCVEGWCVEQGGEGEACDVDGECLDDLICTDEGVCGEWSSDTDAPEHREPCDPVGPLCADDHRCMDAFDGSGALCLRRCHEDSECDDGELCRRWLGETNRGICVAEQPCQGYPNDDCPDALKCVHTVLPDEHESFHYCDFYDFSADVGDGCEPDQKEYRDLDSEPRCGKEQTCLGDDPRCYRKCDLSNSNCPAGQQCLSTYTTDNQGREQDTGWGACVD